MKRLIFALLITISCFTGCTENNLLSDEEVIISPPLPMKDVISLMDKSIVVNKINVIENNDLTFSNFYQIYPPTNNLEEILILYKKGYDMKNRLVKAAVSMESNPISQEDKDNSIQNIEEAELKIHTIDTIILKSINVTGPQNKVLQFQDLMQD
jgi:hypothetical protein